MSRAKQNSLLLLAAAAALTLLLAMMLPNLVLLPGQPFSLEQPTAEAPGGDNPLPGSDIVMYLFQGILALAIIMLPVYIIYSLMTAEGRRRLLVQVVLFVLLFIIADQLHNRAQEEDLESQGMSAGRPMNMDQFSESAPAAVFQAEPPQEFALVVILMISVLATAAGGAIFWYFWQRARTPEFAFAKLAEEAQNAIEAIHAGGDFEATIMRCYQEMSRVLKQEQGIARETYMTPREFEQRLMSVGFTHESLKTLTRLFEQVRYSRIPAGADEQNLALACLADIVDACKGMGKRHEQS
jgi:hypothetical protein